MPIRKLNPYLTFNGTAEKAIKFYEGALEAKAQGIMRWGDAPGAKGSPEDKNRVMHATLKIGEGEVMLADSAPTSPPAVEGNMQVCLDFDDVGDTIKKFNALAVGGKITMPLDDTFWGAKFGMLTDVYGIRWMFNCDRSSTETRKLDPKP